MKKLAIN